MDVLQALYNWLMFNKASSFQYLRSAPPISGVGYFRVSESYSLKIQPGPLAKNTTLGSPAGNQKSNLVNLFIVKLLKLQRSYPYSSDGRCAVQCKL